MIYKVRDWLKHFENNRTRELKELRFIILPNKQDGDGYTELLNHPNGAAHYGAWCAIVQVASKCEPRGTLLRDGARPHDSASLSRLTRISKTVFDEALSRLLLIGWLDDDDATMGAQPTQVQSDSTISQEDATTSASQSRTRLPKSAPELNRIELNRTELNRKEEKRDRPAASRDARLDHPALQSVLKIKGRYPAKDLWNLVIETLGEAPDEARLRDCWVKWRGKGFNAENYGWLTDWYVSGIGANNGVHKSTGYQTAAERRDATFDRQLAVVNELRSRSSGAVDEVLCRKSS